LAVKVCSEFSLQKYDSFQDIASRERLNL